MNRQTRRHQQLTPDQLLNIVLTQLAKDPSQLPLAVKRQLNPRQWQRIRHLVYKLQDDWNAQLTDANITISSEEVDPNDRHHNSSSRPRPSC